MALFVTENVGVRSFLHWFLTLVLFVVLGDNICWLMGVPLTWVEVYDPTHVYDRQNLWLPTPGFTAASEDPSVKHQVWLNNMRASWAMPQKRHPAYRVLLLGCSYTFGVSVPDHETFAWRLNELLPEIEFDNAGVGGYGALRSLVRMRQTLPEKPYDLVIYGMLRDHCNRETCPTLRVEERASAWYTLPEPRSLQNVYILPHTWTDSEFHFFNQYTSRFRTFGEGFSPFCALAGRYATITYALCQPSVSVAQSKILLSRQVSAIATEASIFGCPFLLVTLDGFEYRGSFEKIFSPNFPRLNATFPYPLTPEYRAAHLPRSHPNGIVHEHYARAIADYLGEHRELITKRTACGHRTIYDVNVCP